MQDHLDQWTTQTRAALGNPNLWAVCGNFLLRANPDKDVDESQLIQARGQALRIREMEHYLFLRDLWGNPPLNSEWKGQLALIVTYYTFGERERGEEEDGDSTVTGLGMHTL
ncbi:uncharacterized protein B0J16DRAFT_51785 [Fusarium flagelliforme]|uniref:uncharacterized protein n=1 Tax=Fusarium flagelliforme TaxID=2675880 RepID=UPI001E8CEE4E|nr:uncharacterized protein B0J16DRAFT_51785 [Fusarium flagelliforme]KAH7191954.1 hypothetical protein B0J16DRAFT_51785 [Fusarium flagelliforme]